MKRRTLSSFALSILVFCVASTLCACSSAGTNSNSATTHAATTQEAATTQTTKSSDEDRIDELVKNTIALFKNPTEENMAAAGMEFISEGEDSGSYEQRKAQFANLSYSITSLSLKDKTCTVNLDLTNTDLSAAAELAQKDFATWHNNNSNASIEESQKKMAELLAKYLESGDVPTKTTATSLTCSKDAYGNWQWDELPGQNNDFVYALSGEEPPEQ